LKVELEAECEKELDKCGSQKEKMQEEVQKGLEAGQQRIEKIQEERKKEEDKKAELARLKAEKLEKAKEATEKLTELVTKAETENANLKELVEALSFEERAVTKPAIERAIKQVNAGEEAANAANKECMDLITEVTPTIKDAAVDGETKQACAKLLSRVQESKATVQKTMSSVKGMIERLHRNAAAQDKTKGLEAEFTKFDKDKDKAFNRKEVTAYAKDMFKTKLDTEALDWIWKALVEEGSKGVKVDKLPKLRSVIGVVRELARDKQRTVDRIEKEKAIGGLKDALKEKVSGAEKFVVAANKAIKEVETSVDVWAKKGKVMSIDDMISHVDVCDKKIKAVMAKHDEARKNIGKMSADIEPKYEKDLSEYLADLAKKVELDMSRTVNRIDRVKTISRRFRNAAKTKECDTLEEVRDKALQVVRHNMSKKDASSEDFFNELSKGKDFIDEKAWVAFFESADMHVGPLQVSLKEEDKKEDKKENHAEEKKAADEEKDAEDGDDKKEEDAEEKKETEDEEEKKEEEQNEEKEEEPAGEKVDLSADDIVKAFEYLDEEGDGKLSRESFQRLTKKFMKVVKETAMTSSMGIVGGKALRKLEANEVVEVLKGPVKDDSMRVSRVFCRTAKDNLEGWVSVAGNQGTVFLQEDSAKFKVCKKSVLNDTFEPAEGGEGDDSKTIYSGAIIEVYDFPKKHEESGAFRMRGRVQGRSAKDGIGWVTTKDKAGKVFVKPM